MISKKKLHTKIYRFKFWWWWMAKSPFYFLSYMRNKLTTQSITIVRRVEPQNAFPKKNSRRTYCPRPWGDPIVVQSFKFSEINIRISKRSVRTYAYSVNKLALHVGQWNVKIKLLKNVGTLNFTVNKSRRIKRFVKFKSWKMTNMIKFNWSHIPHRMYLYASFCWKQLSAWEY